MKQTAVEWFFNELPPKVKQHYKKRLEQAKEMEEQQIIEAWINGAVDTNAYTDFAEQYYSKTYSK